MYSSGFYYSFSLFMQKKNNKNFWEEFIITNPYHYKEAFYTNLFRTS
jgi:hypothetical protein